jgi:hypothetical protein
MPAFSDAWQALVLDRRDFGPGVPGSLLAGKAACVVIDIFYPREACSAIAENVRRFGLTRSFTGENTQASFSGLAAIEMVNRQEDYLAAVAETNRNVTDSSGINRTRCRR